MAASGARPDPADDMEADEGSEMIVAFVGLLLAWRLARLDSERRRVSVMALAAPDETGMPSTLE